MRNRVVQLAIGAAIVGAVLTPAVIWGGRRTIGTTTMEAVVKLPEISTIGPEMTPYALTPWEREKLTLPAFSSPIPLDYLSEALPSVVVRGQGRYPGMTRAELDKLAAWRARTWEGTASGTPESVSHERNSISTIEMVPRAPGIEGMTPAERAKLEAYAKEGGRK